MQLRFLFLLLSTLLFSCGKDEEPTDPAEGDWFKPAPGLTFDWQLDEVGTEAEFDVQVVDLDAFTTPKEVVDKLHSQGKKVVAYLSVGTVEDYRPDAGDFPASVIGNDYDGWEGEKWLDIRQTDKLAPVLRARLDMARHKGFDAVEPDNIDGFENPATGFDLSESDAKAFCLWLIEEAHGRGLSIGQKNATGLAPDLVGRFDWLLTEDAYADDFYQDAKVYIEHGKAVFFTEYTDRMTEQDFMINVCPLAMEQHFSAILKDRDLTAGKTSCQ
ncbi:MAG: endo alpha-1,4 polygalactosaminidase [Bacteroidetes bacterium]|nr:endo alpha-1,4 polygalactosaminidase [Bacteroidota bacterium]